CCSAFPSRAISLTTCSAFRSASAPVRPALPREPAGTECRSAGRAAALAAAARRRSRASLALGVANRQLRRGLGGFLARAARRGSRAPGRAARALRLVLAVARAVGPAEARATPATRRQLRRQLHQPVATAGAPLLLPAAVDRRNEARCRPGGVHGSRRRSGV